MWPTKGTIMPRPRRRLPLLLLICLAILAEFPTAAADTAITIRSGAGCARAAYGLSDSVRNDFALLRR